MKLHLLEEDEPLGGSVGRERWLISYADFITVLFALFLAVYVLLPKVTAQHPGAEVLPDKTQSQQLFRAPAESPSVLEQELLAALEQFTWSNELAILRTDEGVALEIRDVALFRPATAEVSPSAQGMLAQIGIALVNRPNKIRVEGHTDNLTISNAVFPSNWELSAARAGRIVRALEAQGVSAHRMSAVGLSDTQPLAPNTTDVGRASNRRVTIVVLDAKN